MTNKVTRKISKEIISHEAIVRQAYKDSKGIWTWGVGVTNASGHSVNRYIGNPQSLERVLEVYEWLLETKYLPDVLEAFQGKELTEEQLGAALSFHWNTGGIKGARWVELFNEGDLKGSKEAFMNWSKPPEIIPRREKERDLFFEGAWSAGDTVTEYTKITSKGQVVWSSGVQITLPEDAGVSNTFGHLLLKFIKLLFPSKG